MEERWKKSAENERPPVPDTASSFNFPFPYPILDPSMGLSSSSVPRFTPQSYYEALANAQISSQQSILQRYQLANGGWPPLSPSPGFRTGFPDQMQVDRFQFAAHEARFQLQNRNELQYPEATTAEALMMARELSSSQKTQQCLSDQCEVCVKKKRYQGENLGFQERSNTSGGLNEMGTNVCNYLGLNMGSGRAVDGGNRNICWRGERQGASPGMHVPEEMESVAIQKKGKSVGERHFKEYNFFPRKGCFNSTIAGDSAAVAAPKTKVGEGSPSAANFLDLSLKLSF